MLAQLREDWHTRQARAAGLLAEARGEVVSARDVLRGWVGRTKPEALAYHSAQMDVEDTQQMARLRREFRHWNDDAIHAEMSADTSAPTLEELAQVEANRESARAAEATRRELVRQRQRIRAIAQEEIIADQLNRQDQARRTLQVAARAFQSDTPAMQRVIGERGWA